MSHKIVKMNNAIVLSNRDKYGDRVRFPYANMAVPRMSSNYGHINMRLVRKALDHITLEDETATVKVPVNGLAGRMWGRAIQTPGHPPTYWKRCNWFEFSLEDSGRVRVKAPCGNVTHYKVKTLDRALTQFGV
jgi:hypothetical protein